MFWCAVSGLRPQPNQCPSPLAEHRRIGAAINSISKAPSLFRHSLIPGARAPTASGARPARRGARGGAAVALQLLHKGLDHRRRDLVDLALILTGRYG